MIQGAVDAYWIGVDLGGTNLRVAAVSENGRIIDKVSTSTSFEHGAEGVVADIVNVITEVRSRLGSLELAGVGIGVPGFIDMQAGVVMWSANLPGFQGFPVR